MARYESITYSRQEDFCIENDLRCRPFDMEIGESAVKMAYHLCGDAALIGEYVISEEGRLEILREGQYILTLLCSGKKERLGLMDGRVLAVACVLLTRNSLNATDEERNSDHAEIWQPILEGLDFPKIAERTGCSEQLARKYLCEILKDRYNVRFFTEGGKQYFNTLRLHALSPEWAIKNLCNVLYGFYHKNLECSYEPGSNVASMFVTGIRRRWEQSRAVGQDKQNLQSDQLSSSLRELFLLRPNYMAAVCDALLEKIDRIVQGDFTKLSEKNRWDVLLLEWYQNKTAYEKSRMQNDRKAAVKRKVVDKKESIRAEYAYENKNIYLCVPGIRLPEIREAPLLQLYQNDQLIQEQRLSIYGDDVLLSTRAHKILLNQVAGINWKKRFCFEIRIVSGENEIYRSGSELFREYLCFTPAGNETRLVRYNQMLRLIVRKSAKLIIEDPEDNYSEEAAPYRSVGIWTESVSRVTLNDEDILQESRSKAKRVWAYLTPESDTTVCARFAEETVAVYSEYPTLHVVFQNPSDAKNYQITVNDSTKQLFEYPWVDGQFRIPLPTSRGRRHLVWLKDFDSGEVVFRRSYTIVPGLACKFDRPFYLDRECEGKLYVNTDRQKMVYGFQLQPGRDKVIWKMSELTFEITAPKVYAEIGEKNAFYLSKHTWYETMKDSFLTIRMPENVNCAVVLGNRILSANCTGRYEIGTEITNGNPSVRSMLLGIMLSSPKWKQEWELTDIHFREFFRTDPIRQEGRRILWDPLEAEFIGGEESAVFRLVLDNDCQSEPFCYTLSMKPDVIEQNFPCKTGTYKYVLWLTNRKKVFTKLPDVALLEGEIYVEDQPEERFENKHIILTHAYYNDPETGRDVVEKMKHDGALIDFIQYEGTQEIDGKRVHEYSGELFFGTANGWKKFSDKETDFYEKINPVFFTTDEEEHVTVYLEDDAPIMLNLKSTKQTYKNGGVRIFSRKEELTKEEQKRYLAFADNFRFIERDN